MAEIAEPKRHSFLVNLFIRLVKEKPLGTVGGVIDLQGMRMRMLLSRLKRT